LASLIPAAIQSARSSRWPEAGGVLICSPISTASCRDARETDDGPGRRLQYDAQLAEGGKAGEQPRCRGCHGQLRRIPCPTSSRRTATPAGWTDGPLVRDMCLFELRQPSESNSDGNSTSWSTRFQGCRVHAGRWATPAGQRVISGLANISRLRLRGCPFSYPCSLRRSRRIEGFFNDLAWH
jgi:hypothetical protein